MVTYDVDTEPRLRIYVGLLLLSVFGAQNVTKGYTFLAKYLNKEYLQYLPKEFSVTLPTSVPITITPLIIFGFLLWLFDRFLWRWPLISMVSGIPDLEGTWKGTLTRTAVTNAQEADIDEKKLMCYITQTWRKIDFVWIDFGSEGPTRVGTARIVGMFVENPQDIHVRFVYGSRQATMLHHLDDLNAMPSEGAAVLRLRRWSEGPSWQSWKNQRRVLQGTYYSDKMRRGDIYLQRSSGRRPTEESVLLTSEGKDVEQRRRASEQLPA